MPRASPEFALAVEILTVTRGEVIPLGRGPLQRSLYDARYRAGAYDRRSAVRVLTAETEALRGAVRRAVVERPNSGLSVFDFGYGTGRVVNDFVDEFPGAGDGRPLRVVAYDIASAGLQKALVEFRGKGFSEIDPFHWNASARQGYVAGSIRRGDVTVVFVHGHEEDSADEMRALAVKANEGELFSVTCSWYSAVGHIVGQQRRREFFEALGEATQPRGDLVVTVSARGDLVAHQERWATRLILGTTGTAPIEVPGDVLYETEVGQLNYYHVFGTDLDDHLRAITGAGQRWWVEGIRLPDEEFASREEEQDNYRRVVAFNQSKGVLPWGPDDYRRFHTVAAFRSASPPD